MARILEKLAQQRQLRPCLRLQLEFLTSRAIHLLDRWERLQDLGPVAVGVWYHCLLDELFLGPKGAKR